MKTSSKLFRTLLIIVPSLALIITLTVVIVLPGYWRGELKWRYVGDPQFSPAVFYNFSFKVNNNTPYIAFAEIYDGQLYGSSVMKFNETEWVNVGIKRFTGLNTSHITIAFYNDIPYVAFDDPGRSYKASVMVYTGETASGWSWVGTRGNSSGRSLFTSINLKGNQPYIAFIDRNNAEKISVKKLLGNNWVPVGTPSFSNPTLDFFDFKFINNVPYIAYTDYENRLGATVMKYSVTNLDWVFLGEPGFINGNAYKNMLGSHNGALYLGVSQTNTAAVGRVENAYILEYNEATNSWEFFGSVPFYNGKAQSLALASENDIAYVAFRDTDRQDKITVLKYENSIQELVGSRGFSQEAGDMIKVEIDDRGIPYVAFSNLTGPRRVSVMRYSREWVPPRTIWSRIVEIPGLLSQ